MIFFMKPNNKIYLYIKSNLHCQLPSSDVSYLLVAEHKDFHLHFISSLLFGRVDLYSTIPVYKLLLHSHPRIHVYYFCLNTNIYNTISTTLIPSFSSIFTLI